MKTKTCTKCGPQPISAFWVYPRKAKGRAGQAFARCKKCENAKRAAHRKAHPLEAAAVARRAKLKRKYGITPEQYDAQLAKQKGVCAICHRPSPDGRRLHVDHCHRTKTFRGLLCHDCNRGIGIFRDNPKLLSRAVSYLK